MTRIIQLSDLHFGRTDDNVVQKLIESINELKPDVIVISGDLTQRAKQTEFDEAKDFLTSLKFPLIIVPGNHDISFYNVWRRFFKPLHRYNEAVNSLNTQYYDSDVVILGINTARSSVFKGGRISTKQVIEAKEKLRISPQPVKIIVTHHPITEVASHEILQELMHAGANVFLAGHLHTASSEGIVKRYKEEDHSALLIQAGTATSIRQRGESNSFNLIEFDALNNAISVVSYFWEGEGFKPKPEKNFSF